MGLSTEQRDWLRLALVPGVGSVHFIQLLAAFRTAGEVLRASEDALARRVGPSLAQRIKQYADVAEVDEQERAMAKYGARLITMDDPAYPLRLAEIYDPPLLLFVRGELHQRDEYSIAIVGTRKASPYGIQIAETLGRGLAARGVTVVSGLASGIDAAAHRGALQAGGRTIAVLGCGVDVVYPRENEPLMQQIIESGCVISQFAMGTKPSPGHFPYRNRIVSGLSMGVVIVEAPLKSGALITARQAAEQGREVFAVPGHVGRPNSQGPHALIRDGAKLVETVDDILIELDLPPGLQPATNVQPLNAPRAVLSVVAPKRPQSDAPPSTPPERMTSRDSRGGGEATEVEKDILAMLSPEGTHVDQIAAACRIPISEALSSLTILELKGLVRQFSGKRFAPR